MRWHADAASAAHQDMKSHAGLNMTWGQGSVLQTLMFICGTPILGNMFEQTQIDESQRRLLVGAGQLPVMFPCEASSDKHASLSAKA